MRRLVPLDVLRALAVLLVMIRHLDASKDNAGLMALVASLSRTPADVYHLPALVAGALHQAGWVGVDLFFVLSGFLVSGLLFREYKHRGDVSVGRFLVRRGFKIYPPFYGFLALTVAYRLLDQNQALNLPALVSEALFVQNYGANLWGHTWSLAVEEHFYLLLALLIFALTRARKPDPYRVLPSLFLVIAALVLALRIAAAYSQPTFSLKTHFFATHLRIDALLFGVVLSYYDAFEPAKVAAFCRHRLMVLAASLVLIAPAFLVPHEHLLMRTIGLTGLYVGFGGLLLVSLSVSAAPNAVLRRLAAAAAIVGRHSYSIYLWHLPVLILGMPRAAKLFGSPLGTGRETLVYLAGSLALGILMAKVIEFPALRVRDLCFPSPSTHL